MKTSIMTILTMLLCSQLLLAQDDNVNLLIQSPDGKTVKLIWFIKKWNSDFTGFDIKRKDGLQNWVKLNKEPIVPEISARKKLSAVESDKIEEGRLKAKLFKLISSHKLREIDNASFTQKLIADEKTLLDVSDQISRDYDNALITGFAFIDHTVSKKTDYEYALFAHSTDRQLDAASWNYGQIPDLNAVKEITSKATTKSNGIQIIWSADADKMKENYVNGFNIYREGIRLNASPIISVNSKDVTEFTWFDKSAAGSVPTQYSISAETIFGIEGIIKPYTYNPADHPDEYKKTEVTDINSLGYYFKDGVSVKWSFPREFERFIKGFYVEKDNMPEGYTRVSQLLSPGDRSYVDKTSSGVTNYIRFRIVAMYNDRTSVSGIERVYNYFPIRQPPAPQNLKVKSTIGDKKVVVTLAWDGPMKGDTTTAEYNVYVNDPVSNNYTLVNENKQVRKHSYTYAIDRRTASVYRFYVSAVSQNKAESAYSDTVTVQTPSFELPRPEIKGFTEEDRAVIRWEYPDISDVKGFRLFQNKVQIAGENDLKKNSREFTTPHLEEGGTYEFTLRAISDNGVLSDLSLPIAVIVPKNTKKGSR